MTLCSFRVLLHAIPNMKNWCLNRASESLFTIHSLGGSRTLKAGCYTHFTDREVSEVTHSIPAHAFHASSLLVSVFPHPAPPANDSRPAREPRVRSQQHRDCVREDLGTRRNVQRSNTIQ